MRAYCHQPILAIVALAVVVLMPVRANAQGEQPTDDEVNAIAKQLYCPVCENVPLDVCGTQACEQWRATIRRKLTAGFDEERIKRYFADQYGVRVLAEPPVRGFNVLLWLVPLMVIPTGILFALRFMHNMRQAGLASTPERRESHEVDGYEARLERELERWE